MLSNKNYLTLNFDAEFDKNIQNERIEQVFYPVPNIKGTSEKCNPF